ncbi:MAG TPA: alpha-amylase family glycosyl hydrolase, partial [Arenibacter sp.]|nr:alpha-amylase family glycosyl hydrolase [Arenibacter sp.]
QQTAITNYNFDVSVTQNTNFALLATHSGETKTVGFKVVVSPTVGEASVPTGMLDGINLDPLDPTRATLVLYAPLKGFVHVIGDFNNWQIDDTYLMKKDSAKDRFWIELTGLTPQTDYLYQYLVDFQINVADPYSTLILDPYSDQYIDEVTFPDLPQYPTNLTTEAVTVLRTGDLEYVWQVTDFVAPQKSDLVIYEVLLRDFDARHSFDALRERLDYLQELGINAIELMPVSEFDGNESWGYNPSFHMALDKYYGTKDALKALIDECHSRGMAVILDVVYNHATGQNPYFRLWNDTNGGLSGKATTENPFFNQEARHSYSVFNDYDHQSAATQYYVERTTQYWINEFKLDGFRWDLTKGFTQNCSSNDEACTNAYQQDRVDVLKQYADKQWEVNADFYVIFEHLGTIVEEEQWADYRADEGKGILLWNKQTESYNEATMGYNNSGKSNFSGVSYLQKGFNRPAAISYMESHDEERLMYKNLHFGNTIGNYSTKDTNTALDRMQTAGAFFFTVPGPKMIWQFGELGYDISIDQNGRVGNKPILWEYVNDKNRIEVYNTYSKLIELKKKLPVFNTPNFSIDASNANGIKRIHLDLDSAGEDDIKYVVVVGNFGMETETLDLAFQETGTWHNLMHRNKPLEVTNVSAPIILAPGEFLVYGDKPFIDPNDLDSDGVINSDDQCANTPLGATVDVFGCEVFTLPVDNFMLSATSETCRSANNGKINISVVRPMDYSAAVSGPGNYTMNTDFTDGLRIENLEAGRYKLCFGVDGQASYKQCFDIEVDEPEDLSVISKIDRSEKSVSLSLKGGAIYFVTLNGTTSETGEQDLILQLKSGMNSIRVDTGVLCQGIFETQIFVSEDLSFFPNPVGSELSIYCGGIDKKVEITIYDFTGRILYRENREIASDRIVRVETSHLVAGKYVASVKGATINETFKIIK